MPRRRSVVTVLLLVVSVVVLAATSQTDDVPQTTGAMADLPSFQLGGDAAAVEIPVTVDSEPDVGDRWSSWALTVDLDDLDAAGAVVELLRGSRDGSGERMAVATVAADQPDAVTTFAIGCDADGCERELTLRIRPIDPTGGRFEGFVGLKASGFGVPEGPLGLTTARPAVLAPDQLAAAAPMSPPTTLAIDAATPVAGARIDLGDCGGEVPWIVPLAAGDPVGAPQLRLITVFEDTPVAAGSGTPVPDVCDGEEGDLWVVLAAPLSTGVLTLDWVVLGGTGDATATPATVTATDSESVDVGDDPVVVGPVALPTGEGALHLVEGVDEAGGGDDADRGPDAVDAEPADARPEPIVPPTGSLRAWPGPWAGTGFAPVAAGPCPLECPTEVDLELSYALEGPPVDGPLRAHATVISLVVP